MHILAFLWVLSAKSTLSLALFPQIKTYSMQFSQQSGALEWESRLVWEFPNDLVMTLPSRFRIGMDGGSISLGYAGFWQSYVLLPFFSTDQALIYQRGDESLMMLFFLGNKRAIGYEHVFSLGELSALAWMQERVKPSSFQAEWGARHSQMGIATRALLATTRITLHLEMLFTPVTGMDFFLSSSFRHAGCELKLAFGEDPYPMRYFVALSLQGVALQANFTLEDWFGSNPIYGGYSAIRRRKQSSSLKLSAQKGYLLFSFSDCFEFRSRGGSGGSVLLQAKWSLPPFQMSVRYAQGRGSTKRLLDDGKCTLSLHIYKVSISYTAGLYEVSLTDSFAFGKGVGTFALQKTMGKGVSLALFYTVTSDR